MLNIVFLILLSCGSKQVANKDSNTNVEIGLREDKPKNTEELQDDVEALKFKLLTEHYMAIDKSKLGPKSLEYLNLIKDKVNKQDSSDDNIDLKEEDVIALILRETLNLIEVSQRKLQEELLLAISTYYHNILSISFDKLFNTLIRSAEIAKKTESNELSCKAMYLEELLYLAIMNVNINEEQEKLILDLFTQEQIEFSQEFKEALKVKNKAFKKKERNAKKRLNESKSRILTNELVKLGSEHLAAIREEEGVLNLSVSDISPEFSFRFNSEEDIISESGDQEERLFDSILDGSFSILGDENDEDLSQLDNDVRRAKRNNNILKEIESFKRIMKYVGIEEEDEDDDPFGL